LIFLVAMMPNTALACGKCVLAIFDRLLPPIHFWMVLGLAWFILNGLIAALFNQHLPAQPRLLITLALAIGGYISGWAVFGPWAAFILAGIAINSFLRSILPLGYKWPSLALRRAIAITGVVILCFVAYGTTQLVHILRTRTVAQFIVQWGGTTSTPLEFDKLRKREPSSLSDYRYIVTHGSNYVASRAARRIGAISNDWADTLLLKEAAKRSPANGYHAGYYQAALDTLRARLASAK
jgi:hypothetical protein